MFKVFSDLFDRAMLALMNPDELIPAFLPERIRGLITWFLSMMALLGSVPLPLSPGPNIELRSTVMQSRVVLCPATFQPDLALLASCCC